MTVPNFTPRSGEGGWGAARADLTQAEPSPAGAWVIERARGAPADLHRLGLPDPVRRLVRWCVPDRPALVLGSAQPQGDADDAAARSLEVAVVRRVSGGSAVLVGPGHVLWADVVIPRRDPLWSDDVGIAPRWLGRVWATALARPDAIVHEGPMHKGAWGHLVCFGGVGSGEVLLNGRKVVGVSQRRTREGALFQCAVLSRWEPAETLAVLNVADRDAAAVELGPVAVGVSPDGIEAAFERALRSL